VLEDKTGTLKFVSWENDSPPTVKQGVWYRFSNVKTNEFNDQTQIVLNSDTEVTKLYD